MLKNKLVPTPLVTQTARPPIPIVEVDPTAHIRSLTLGLRIIAFVFQIMWARNIRKRPDAELAPRIRHFVEGLGGMWIKAGQLLSLRVDILSPAMVDELSQLQYRTYGFPPEIARRVIEESLGQPIDRVFEVFEDQPIAAASVSQVHRARLRNKGHWVAVKVQRPAIEQVFVRDMNLIEWLLNQMKRIPSVDYLDWDGMVRELRRMMTEEVDFRYEISNLRRMRKLLKSHKVYVPRVYRRLSSQKVIVMEFIPGVLMSEYIRMKSSNPERVERWQEDNNVKPRKVGSRLMRSFYRQLYEDNLFHGDLHPGNIMLLRNSRVALLDLGTIGTLETRFVRLYRDQARAFAEGDFSKAMDLYLLLVDTPIDPIDITTYRMRSVEVARTWQTRSNLEGLTYLERSITGGFAVAMGDVNRDYRINISWQFLRVGRSISTMDANLSILLEGANPNRILKKYFKTAQARALRNLRREGVKEITRFVSETRDTIGYLSESLRREAIQFKGVQSKVAHFFEVIFSAVRTVVFVIGLVLLYDFLHLFYFRLVGGINERVGILAWVVERIPPYNYWVGLLGLFLIIMLFRTVHQIKQRFGETPLRLPSKNNSN